MPGTVLLLAASPVGKSRLVDAASVLPVLAAVPPTVLSGTDTANVVELADPLEPQAVLTRLRAVAATPGPLTVFVTGQLALDRRQHLPHLALARTTPATVRYTALPWQWIREEFRLRSPGSTTLLLDLHADADAWGWLRTHALDSGRNNAVFGRIAPPPSRRTVAAPAVHEDDRDDSAQRVASARRAAASAGVHQAGSRGVRGRGADRAADAGGRARWLRPQALVPDRTAPSAGAAGPGGRGAGPAACGRRSSPAPGPARPGHRRRAGRPPPGGRRARRGARAGRRPGPRSRLRTGPALVRSPGGSRHVRQGLGAQLPDLADGGRDPAGRRTGPGLAGRGEGRRPGPPPVGPGPRQVPGPGTGHPARPVARPGPGPAAPAPWRTCASSCGSCRPRRSSRASRARPTPASARPAPPSTGPARSAGCGCWGRRRTSPSGPRPAPRPRCRPHVEVTNQ